MLLLFSAVIAAAALLLLAFSSIWGVAALFVARPFVDTAWDQPLVLGLKLTEIVSGAVPILIWGRMLMSSDPYERLARMPLRTLWLVWLIYTALFGLGIVATEGLESGLNVFLRHANGFVGFYMVQAYCRDERQTRIFIRALIVAGLFPIGTGAFEALTGHHWRVTYGEGSLVRNIGFYHDAITIRYLALQTIMGLLLLIGLYGARRQLLAVAAAIYGAIASLIIYKAYSKSGYLTLASWLVLWPLLRRRYAVLLALGAVAFIVVGWNADTLLANVAYIFHKELAAVQGTGAVERSFAGRWYLWQGMLDQWRDFGAFAQMFGSGHVATGAHNDYIQVLFHGGIVGVTIYVVLLGAIFLRIVRNLISRIDVLAVAALLAMLMWLVDTIGLVPSAYPGYQWFVWGVIGLALRRREEQTRAVPAPEVAPLHGPAPAFEAASAVLLPRRHPATFLNVPDGLQRSTNGSS